MEFLHHLNFATILTLAFAVVGLASAIAKVTPTQADNKVVDFILDVLNKLALNPTKDDARMPK